MSIVFAVCTGEYETYWPTAVFTNRAHAEAFLKECADGEIQELVLDDPDIIAGVPRWLVFLDSSGTLTQPTVRSIYPPSNANTNVQPFLPNEFWITIAAASHVDAEDKARRLVLSSVHSATSPSP